MNSNKIKKNVTLCYITFRVMKILYSIEIKITISFQLMPRNFISLEFFKYLFYVMMFLLLTMNCVRFIDIYLAFELFLMN